METGFFNGVHQWELRFNETAFKLPVFYYDTTSLTAVYTASSAEIKKRLPLPGMNPIEALPGRCLVAFTAFEYRRTDIDPYNEFSIAFLVTYKRRAIPLLTAAGQMLRRRLSAYVWQLPVTTEIARLGGVEMYGYPKFIADIEFRREDGQLVCRLAEKGREILRLSGKTLPTRQQKISRIQTYSVKHGIPLLANIFFNPLQMAVSSSRQAAQLAIGSGHPLCAELRALKLSALPVQYQYSPLNQAILFAGRNLMDT